MDETPPAPPHAPPHPPPHGPHGSGRRIVREPDDRKIAGVCSGLADHLGIDVTMMRVAAVVLTLVTPAALIAYLVASVALPERPADEPRVRARNVHLGQVPHPLIVVGAIVAVAVLVDDAWWLDPFPAAIALVGIGVWLVVSNREEASAADTPPQSPPPPGTPSSGSPPPGSPPPGTPSSGTPSSDPSSSAPPSVDAPSAVPPSAGSRSVVAPSAGSTTAVAPSAGSPTAEGAAVDVRSAGPPPMDAPPADTPPEDGPTAQHPTASSPWLVSVSQHSGTDSDGDTTLTAEQAPDLSEQPRREGAGPSGEFPPPASPWWSGHPPAPGHVPPVAPVSSRPRQSRAGSIVVALLLIGAGTLWLLAEVDAVDLDAADVLALGLLVIGAGLVATSWRGRGYALIPLGFVLAGTLVAGEAIDIPLDAGVGDRTVIVDTVDEMDTRHELFLGDLTLDLTNASLRAGTTEVEAAVGGGELRVVVPRDAVVVVNATVRAGGISSPGGAEANEDGLGVDSSFTLEPVPVAGPVQVPDSGSGSGSESESESASESESGSARSDPPVLVLDLSIGVGNLEVNRG